ncbi:hypothetical protein RFI_06093 [Reticulomyxa filosa]|uniref:Uncharacterized protein n=1 Tax=Reticulomyxa filosa TaxID=46433 RepID=X6NYR2_RETFI|nr:hypothetical protein RFI_06093 [Reticulomyxa filosa]|eukprot:ETO31028.1 hypothetical protein RFI_06093 [Reticulomyxa filosa]
MTQFQVPPDPYLVTNLSRKLRNSFYLSALEVSEIDHYLEIQWMYSLLLEESMHVKVKRDEDMESRFRRISDMLNHFQKLLPDAVANMQVNDIAKVSYRKQMDPLQRARQRHWYLINSRVARVCETMLNIPGLRFFYGQLPLEQYAEPLQHIQYTLEYLLYHEKRQNAVRRTLLKEMKAKQKLEHEALESEGKKSKDGPNTSNAGKDKLGVDGNAINPIKSLGDGKTRDDNGHEGDEDEAAIENESWSLYDMSKRLYRLLVKNFPHYNYQDMVLCVSCDTKYHATSGKGFFTYQFVSPEPRSDGNADVIFITFILAHPPTARKNCVLFLPSFLCNAKFNVQFSSFSCYELTIVTFEGSNKVFSKTKCGKLPQTQKVNTLQTTKKEERKGPILKKKKNVKQKWYDLCKFYLCFFDKLYLLQTDNKGRIKKRPYFKNFVAITKDEHDDTEFSGMLRSMKFELAETRREQPREEHLLEQQQHTIAIEGISPSQAQGTIAIEGTIAIATSTTTAAAPTSAKPTTTATDMARAKAEAEANDGEDGCVIENVNKEEEKKEIYWDYEIPQAIC